MCSLRHFTPTLVMGRVPSHWNGPRMLISAYFVDDALSCCAQHMGQTRASRPHIHVRQTSGSTGLFLHKA